MNGLYRFFAETDPIVGAALSIHSSLPLAEVSLGTCEDTGVQQHYEEMWDRINGVKLLGDIVSEYHEIGDCLTAETEILTTHGYKRADQIRVGDLVLTSTGKYEKVLKVMPRKLKTGEKVYKVIPWKVNLNRQLTERHPILTTCGFKKVKDLTTKDMVRVSLPKREVEDVESIDLPSSESITTTFKNSRDTSVKALFVHFLLTLKEPVTMTYQELATYLITSKRVIASIIRIIEASGARVLRERIHNYGNETTKWIGIDLKGFTKEQIVKGNTTRKFTSTITKININDDFMYMLGYWLGDGYLFHDPSLQRYGYTCSDWGICFSKQYKYIAEKISKTTQSVFGIHVPISGGAFNQDISDTTIEGAPFQLWLRDPMFCKWWEKEFSCGSRGKKIPQWVLNLPDEKLKHLLAGMIDSDGNINNSGFEIECVNKYLITQFFHLGLYLGYPFTIGENFHTAGQKLPKGAINPNSFTSYKVEYKNRDNALELLTYSLKDKHSFKKEKISQARQRMKRDNDGNWYTEIRKVKEAKYNGVVYDFHIENTHDFDCSGIIVHNCVPFGAFNEADYMWDQFAILNPDYVKIESTWINQKPLIKLVPDEVLKRIVQTQSPRYIYEQLPPEIARYVLFNQEIPLAPNNTFHLAYAKRPYEVRGRSLIKRILKVLMLEDRFMQAEFALATRHAVPLTIVKLGDQSVEEDHLITFKEKEELKVMSFDSFWKQYDGIVATENGKNEIKNISQHNLYTQALNEEGENVWVKMKGVLRHKTPDNVVEIHTPNAKIRSTEAHGMMRLNPSTLELEAVTPKELEEEGSTVVTMNKFDYSIHTNKVFDDIPLTEDLAYLIGLWTADGSINGVGKNTTMLNISSSNVAIQEYIKSLEGKEIENVRVSQGSNDTTVYFRCTALKKAILKYYNFTKWGAKTGIEKVPNEILFNSNDKIVGAFFAGVVDGDGWLFRDSVSLGISCGASNEYHHILSLALLSKGIVSRVRSSSEGYYELCVDNKENLTKAYNLIQPYLQHSKKKELCKKNLEKLSTYGDGCGGIDNVFKVSDDVLFNMFSIKGGRKEGTDKWNEKPLNYVGKRKYLRKNVIEEFGEDCWEKERLKKFYGVGVFKVSRVKKHSTYVYDLMLEDDPHTYLVAGKGWMVVHNTHGWVPGPEEMDEVREMMAAWELDPNFSIIYHWGIDVQYYGSNGKMLPIGPELDRMYRLKFIGMGVHEQLLTGAGGSYSQAYINLEVQRQRYLNLQLKLEQLVHDGWFKPVADLCGFYKVKSAVAGYGGVSNVKWGEIKDYKKGVMQQFTTLRDSKDNIDFQKFVSHMAAEQQKQEQKQVKEYIYPEIDWGGMSAANDENLKNYVKWLVDKRPYLVDDATLAKLGKLDRDKQEDAYIKDLRRAKKRYAQITKEQLLPFMDKGKGQQGGGGDFGGGG